MTLSPEQLAPWPVAQPVAIAPVPRSENLVFRLAAADGQRFILRVHRAGYHTETAIASELAWISALGRDTEVQVPEIIATRNGGEIAPIVIDGEHAPRLAVLFREHPGDQPDENDPRLPQIFEALGTAAARCHNHVLTWRLPAGFTRPDWSITGMLGPKGIWGDWRAAPELSLADKVVLGEAELELFALFNTYASGADRFGLIHNDMRPSNFLWAEDRLRLLDFDDCGFGWFIADFAASVSWFEDDPRLPELFRSWLKGYRGHRPLSDADIAMAGPALMARRMLLLAWTASRAETDLATTRRQGFAAGTVALARRFLKGEPLV